MKRTRSVLLALVALAAATSAHARGASPYLPLSLSPYIERQIERVLILAGKPVMRRPIAAAVVLDALPDACRLDRVACDQVRQFLDRYMNRYGVVTLQAEGAVSSGDSAMVIPNRHGQTVDSNWRVVAGGYYQPNDYVILNVGAVAHEDEVTATGSFLSAGFHFAQLDIGFRDHWLSPLTDSSSLISTQARTMPSITVSNYEPISPLGISYEVFAAQMSHHDGIATFDGAGTSGRPRIAGLHLSMEPVVGYALGINRITQYGGGSRGGNGFSDFFDALITSSNRADTASAPTSEVNRVAAVTSSILFPGKVPFAVHVEYAGEDNAYERVYRLGAVNLSLGIDFPVLWKHFDAGYEISEWQNSWYVHHLYAEGLTNDGRVIGHWFGDNRLPGDGIGGRSQMLRGGWRLPNGDYLQARYRNMKLDARWSFNNPVRPYETLHMLEVNYETELLGHAVDAHAHVGRDIFGESFARIGAAFSLVRAAPRRSAPVEPAESSDTEFFVDIGAQYSRVREYLLLQFRQRDTTSYEPNYHFGVGARRPVSRRNDIGVRLEIDRIHDHDLLSVRLLDYRFRINEKLALGANVGVARYDLGLPADGAFVGAGAQYRNVLPGWDVSLEYRLYDKLTRDKGLASDPESNPGLPRRIIDLHSVSLYLTKKW